MAEVVLIAAVGENGVIGSGGAIPWRLPEDMRRFKALTLGHPVVMGRKTWDSLPKKPLPHRANIVVTRRKDWQEDGATAAGSVEEALARDDTTFIIGGAEIYRAALPLATRIELTEVHSAFTGDAYFPALDKTRWRETSREPHATPDGLRYSFVTLERA